MTPSDLKAIMEITIQRYNNMLKKFTPCKPGSGEFLEQNLITNFALAYTSKLENANSNIYTEVPFICAKKDDKVYWKCRADLYIENGENGYIIEAKGSQKGDKLFNLIEDDISRLVSDELRESFLHMSKGRENLPKNMYGIIIADFWGTKYQNTDENSFINQWKNNAFDKNPNLKKLIKNDPYLIFDPTLKETKSDYPYWFLAGIIKLDW